MEGLFSLRNLPSMKTRELSSAATAPEQGAGSLWGLLIGLMIPVGMTTFNMSMFGVALPTVRDAFGAEADLTAWLVTAYSLPFVIFMPLYGKLGDSLGKARLFQSGIVLFFVGTLVCLLARNLPQLLIGRILQGTGTAGFYPLCIAIIAERFPPSHQGRAMGTWSSVAPGAASLGPLLGGFAVNQFGWNYVFVPSLLVGVIAMWVVYRQVPAQRPVSGEGLQAFDWQGAAFLGGTLVFAMFYLSSRTVSGVEPLRDWRFLAVAIAFGFLFWRRESRTAKPMVNFALYNRKNFGVASMSAGCRMIIMHTGNFLYVLYLTDVYGLNAMELGAFSTVFAVAILSTTRLGGQLADRIHYRWIVGSSFAIQCGALTGLALLSPPLFGAAGLILAQALGGGLALAALHRAAMEEIPAAESGAAAGLYSTARFGGGVIGATVAGVALQQALRFAPGPGEAFQWVFGAVAVISLASVLVAWRLQR